MKIVNRQEIIVQEVVRFTLPLIHAVKKYYMLGTKGRNSSRLKATEL